MNYPKDSTISVCRRQFEAAADAAMDAAAVAHEQVHRDDPIEISRLERMRRNLDELLSIAPYECLPLVHRIRHDLYAEITFDREENAKHTRQLLLGRTWAPALDEWAGEKDSRPEVETRAAESMGNQENPVPAGIVPVNALANKQGGTVITVDYTRMPLHRWLRGGERIERCPSCGRKGLQRAVVGADRFEHLAEIRDGRRTTIDACVVEWEAA